MQSKRRERASERGTNRKRARERERELNKKNNRVIPLKSANLYGRCYALNAYARVKIEHTEKERRKKNQNFGIDDAGSKQCSKSMCTLDGYT